MSRTRATEARSAQGQKKTAIASVGVACQRTMAAALTTESYGKGKDS